MTSSTAHLIKTLREAKRGFRKALFFLFLITQHFLGPIPLKFHVILNESFQFNMVQSPLALSSVPVRPTVGKFGLHPRPLSWLAFTVDRYQAFQRQDVNNSCIQSQRKDCFMFRHVLCIVYGIYCTHKYICCGWFGGEIMQIGKELCCVDRWWWQWRVGGVRLCPPNSVVSFLYGYIRVIESAFRKLRFGGACDFQSGAARRVPPKKICLQAGKRLMMCGQVVVIVEGRGSMTVSTKQRYIIRVIKSAFRSLPFCCSCYFLGARLAGYRKLTRTPSFCSDKNLSLVVLSLFLDRHDLNKCILMKL